MTRFARPSVFLLAALIGCGAASEKDELARFFKSDIKSILEKGKPLDINYWAYAQNGTTDREGDRKREVENSIM
jgi:hypothetical protein